MGVPRGPYAFWFVIVFLFFFNDTATTEIYTLSLHDALPISGGDQWHLWKRRLERFDIRCASELGAGEDFDEVDTGFPRHHHLGWGESAGENDDLLLVCELHDLEIEPGGG